MRDFGFTEHQQQDEGVGLSFVDFVIPLTPMERGRLADQRQMILGEREGEAA